MRSRSGKPLVYLGRGYFVLLDKDEETEVSDRAPGEAWLAVNKGSISVILHPDSTDREGLVMLSTHGATAYAFGTGLEDAGLLVVQPIYSGVRPTETFQINWNPMLDAML